MATPTVEGLKQELDQVGQTISRMKEEMDQSCERIQARLQRDKEQDKLVTDGLCWMLLGCATLLAPVPAGVACITIGGWKLIRSWIS